MRGTPRSRPPRRGVRFRPRSHPLGEVGWGTVLFLWILGTAHPLYLLLALAVLLPGTGLPPWAWSLPLLGAAFNLAAAHAGGTVLWRLPEAIPFFGGAWTLEAAVWGGIQGLRWLALLALIRHLGRRLGAYELLHLIPPLLLPLALSLSVAVSFFPLLLASAREVWEVQQLRFGRRSPVRLAVPVLELALERATCLAESLEVQGFGARSRGEERAGRQARRGVLAGLLLLFLGWSLAWGGEVVVGLGLGLLGGGALLWAQRRARRAFPRTRARTWVWDRRAWAGLARGLLLLALWGGAAGAFRYLPYPRLTWPPFSPLLGLGVLAAAWPPVLTDGDGPGGGRGGARPPDRRRGPR